MPMTPDEMRAFDESMAAIAERFPPMWKRIYDNLIAEGFDEVKAFHLLRTWIISQSPGGAKSPDR